jgi:uncharacterized membrane protein
MSSNSNDLALFLGHLHPMLVHLPIGSLVLLGILELLALLPHFNDAAQARRVILGFSTIAALAAVSCGWLLSRSGDYDPQLLRWHRIAGFAIVGTCALSFLLCRPNRLRAYRVSLLATLVLVVVGGHFGSALTHGRDFFSRYAPGPLRFFLGAQSRPGATTRAPDVLMQRRLFADVVQPILRQRCSACHGPEKQKGELQVDSLAAMLKGGKSGPALVPGKAAESLMIQRLLLPLEHDDHMPPEGKPQPTPAEIGLLHWWINAGAPEDGTVGAHQPDANVVQMLGTLGAASR